MKGRLRRTQGVLLCSHLNWTNREREEGWDKRARITTKRKSFLGRERASPGLAIHCGK